MCIWELKSSKQKGASSKIQPPQNQSKKTQMSLILYNWLLSLHQDTCIRGEILWDNPELLGIMIQDSSDLHSLKKLLKPIRKRICWYLWWCTMMWVILHHTSDLDPYKGTWSPVRKNCFHWSINIMSDVQMYFTSYGICVHLWWLTTSNIVCTVTKFFSWFIIKLF